MPGSRTQNARAGVTTASRLLRSKHDRRTGAALSTIDRLRARGLAPLALAFAVVAQLGMAAGLTATVGLALPGWLALGLWTALGYALLQPHADRHRPAGPISPTPDALSRGGFGLLAGG